MIENQLKQEAELQQKKDKEAAAAESDRKKLKQDALSDSDEEVTKPESQGLCDCNLFDGMYHTFTSLGI